MIAGSNYLNIDRTARGLYRVVAFDGYELSGLFNYADIHAICYAVCVKEDHLYNELTNYGGVLNDVPGDYTVWLDFSDSNYHARPKDYVPEWYEIYVGNVKEVNKWLEKIC